MQGRVTNFVVAFVLAGVFAGCIQAESGAVQSANPEVAAGPAQFDETTGGIEGVLTDSELAPIAGALIGLLQSDSLPEPMSVTTDEAGHFTISHVPPGEHTLQASALGFEATSKRVAVEVGAIATISLALKAIPIAEAYGETLIMKSAMSAVMWRLTPQCMYFSNSVPEDTPSRNLLKTCGGLRTGCDPDICETHFTDEFLKETGWKSIVAEMSWQPQSGVTGKGFQLDVNAPNITRSTGGSIDQASPYTWAALSGKSPIVIRIDNPTTLVERQIPESDWYSYPDGEGCTAFDEGDVGNCDWFFRIFGGYCDLSSVAGDCSTAPVDYGLPQDNTFELYFSYFYLEPAAPGFTALPDM